MGDLRAGDGARRHDLRQGGHRHQGHGRAADRRQFKTAEASVPGDRLAFAYVDTAAVLKGADGRSRLGRERRCPACRRSWATCRSRGPRSRSAPRTARSSWIRRRRTWRRWARRRRPNRSCPRSSRPTTVALVEGHDVGAALERAKTLLAEDPSLADGVKQVDDTLALLGGFGAIVDWMGEAGVAVTIDGGTVAGGIVAIPLDPAAPEQLFTQLRGFLELAGGSSGITVTEEPYNGATIVVVDLGDLGSLAGAATGGRRHRIREPQDRLRGDRPGRRDRFRHRLRQGRARRRHGRLARQDGPVRIGAQARGQGERGAPVARRRRHPRLRRDPDPRERQGRLRDRRQAVPRCLRQRDRHLRAGDTLDRSTLVVGMAAH